MNDTEMLKSSPVTGIDDVDEIGFVDAESGAPNPKPGETESVDLAEPLEIITTKKNDKKEKKKSKK